MSTANPFELLGHDENDDPSQLVLAAEQLKLAAPDKKAPVQAAAPAKPGKLPTKPLPPSQAVREARNEGGRGGARGPARGRGRGRAEFNREPFNNDSTYGGAPVPVKGSEEGKTFERRGGYGGPCGSFRGGRRGGYSNGEEAEGGERTRRVYERHSGTGRDNGFKRDGAGRGNWGTPTDEIAPEIEEVPIQREIVEEPEKQSGEEEVGDVNKEKTEEAAEEKEPEAKEMTLEEYEKVLEEKRKALSALKPEERKVDDKEFKSMQQISSKKNNDEIFIKLGSEKDKRREVAEKDEKSVNITEFLKPAERERSYGGRGRGRGRGPRGGFTGGSYNNTAPPANIEDPGHFPALGVK
uniref:Hyaluronan/mRNA-binding protein domain-containing protein n=1 Tax=Kalanchoe fedtschenkoi TaxID=63787 RepID=A0A7N0UU41_KALFE